MDTQFRQYSPSRGLVCPPAGTVCTVAVLDYTAETKLAAINRLGAEAVKVSMTDGVEILRTRKYEGMEGLFIHPFSPNPPKDGLGDSP